MAVDIILLRMGSTTMTSALVLAWMAEIGDEVTDGDPLVAIETDKVEVEIPAPATGVLIRRMAEPGDEIPVGGKLGEVGTAEELTAAVAEPPDEEPPTDDDDLLESGSPPPAAGVAKVAVPAPSGELRAAPPARKLARQLGIDLAGITGTGPGGRIQSADVRAAAAEPKPAPRSATSDTVRRRTAVRMAQSAAETAPVTLTRQIDAGALTARSAHLKENHNGPGRSPSIEDLIIAACAQALTGHPDLNSSWTGGSLVPGDGVNINVAIQAPQGLVVPVVRSADSIGLDEIAAERRRLTALALDGSLAPDDMAGGTFTISNLGMHGVDAFTPIITLPQVAVLGIGRIRDTVVPQGRGLVVTPSMWLSLTFDHRAVDGAPAAEFLAAIAERIENPSGQ